MRNSIVGIVSIVSRSTQQGPTLLGRLTILTMLTVVGWEVLWRVAVGAPNRNRLA